MASRKRSALGKGIGSLIPDNQKEPAPVDMFFGSDSTQSSEENKMKKDAVVSSSSSPVDLFFGDTPPQDSSLEGEKAEAITASMEQAVERAAERITRTSSKKKDGKKQTKHTQSQKKKVREESNTPIRNQEQPELLPVPGVTYGEIPLAQIVANSRQPRTIFDEDDLKELAASIREVGVLQPIVVRPIEGEDSAKGDARYELIMGERRWRASQLAGISEIPAIVRRTADEDLLRDALLENLHRANLNPIEEAAAYQQLLDDFECTHEELSRRIARSRPQITNTLRLLKLPPLVQRRLAAGTISAGHARALLSLADAADMEKLAQRIVAEGLSVRAVEELVSLWESPAEEAKPTRTSRAPSPELEALAVRLGDAFDTKVKVAMGARKGSIRIDFAGLDDLNRIVAVLAPGIEGVEASVSAPSNPAGTSASAGGQAYELGY